MDRTTLRHIAFIILLIFTTGCQQEQLSVIDEQEDINITEDADLIALVQGVTAHDGSHDDIVDRASCFSIDFPYQLKVNGALLTIAQLSDLAAINDDDEVEAVYPLQITFADYTEAVVNNAAELNAHINSCSNGSYYNQSIACIDLIYPVRMSEYNPETRAFQTVIYDHDRNTFNGIRRMLSEGSIAQLKFPITVQVIGGETLEINSNEQFKAVISSNLDFCF